MTKEKETNKGNAIIGWGVGFFIASIIIFILTIKRADYLALGVEVLIVGFLTMLVLIGIGYVIKELRLLRMDLDKYLSKKEKT